MNVSVKLQNQAVICWGLINEVLDMARIESGKMTLAQEDFNLPDLVDNLITLTKPVIDEHKSQFRYTH